MQHSKWHQGLGLVIFNLILTSCIFAANSDIEPLNCGDSFADQPQLFFRAAEISRKDFWNLVKLHNVQSVGYTSDGFQSPFAQGNNWYEMTAEGSNKKRGTFVNFSYEISLKPDATTKERIVIFYFPSELPSMQMSQVENGTLNATAHRRYSHGDRPRVGSTYPRTNLFWVLDTDGLIGWERENNSIVPAIRVHFKHGDQEVSQVLSAS